MLAWLCMLHVAECCNQIFVLASISQKQHVQTSANFHCVFTMALSRSSSDSFVMCTSGFLDGTSCFAVIDGARATHANVHKSVRQLDGSTDLIEQWVRYNSHCSPPHYSGSICRRNGWQISWGKVWCLQLPSFSEFFRVDDLRRFPHEQGITWQNDKPSAVDQSTRQIDSAAT